MQREIKFRAWDDDQKEMTTDLVVYGDGIFEVALDYCGACSQKKYGLPDSIGMTADKRWVLMQFTGLKDKNGKEIWEGDIVLAQLEDEMGFAEDSAERIFTDEARKVVVEWDNEIGSYHLPSDMASDEYYPAIGNDGFYRVEVIGNIYEHSHLLKA